MVGLLVVMATTGALSVPAGAARVLLRSRSIRTTCRRRAMIRKLKSGEYRLYSRKKDPRTGRRRNLGTFATLEAAKQHEREVQFFKRR
jgi:hypothetical protein